MRDDFGEELISAYLDGELDADERALVERAMAESAEYRQLYEELQVLRAGLQRLPRYKLPADFRQRVLRQAERRLLAPSADIMPSASAAQPAVGPSRRRWRAAALAASLAAAILFALLLVSQLQRTPAPRSGPRPIDDLAGNPPGLVKPEVGPEETKSLPSRNQIARAVPEWPIYFMVIDLAITPQGQEKKVFEESIKAAGIRFDPSIKVDEALEKDLLENRFIGDIEKVVPEPNQRHGSEAIHDEIAMFFVAGAETQIEAAILGLQNRPREEISQVKFDMTIESKKQDIFRQLNSAVRLARDEAVKAPRAYRLVFRFSLRSASLGFLGTIATPSLTTQLVPEERPRDEQADLAKALRSLGAQPADGKDLALPAALPARPDQRAQASKEPEPEDAFAEVLFILRNLKQAPASSAR